MDDIRRKLEKELAAQVAERGTVNDPLVDRYLAVAAGYADVEGALAVLSDLACHSSYIFNGIFSKSLNLGSPYRGNRIHSIWEQEILDIIHPLDLENKVRQELLFFHFIKKQPKSLRFTLSLHQPLRMMGKNGEYVASLHRIHYIPDRDGASLRFALCLYNPAPPSETMHAVVVDKAGGATLRLDTSAGQSILSRQETAVLRLLAQGHTSKTISVMLSISVHTVSRHRQNINAKLRVHNTTEACRLAKTLGIMT